jgi:hypothetical protein
MIPATDGAMIDFATGAPATGSLEVAWIHGVPSKRHAPEPKIGAHHYDEHTVILRQGKSVSYEAPFLYLLFGNERALLLDTGATADAVRFTCYDPWTGFLLTGDTVLPGRLYAFDYPAFLATLDRLVAFTDRRKVTHVLGVHVDMTNQPGTDYPLGARYQPDERAPQLTVAQLIAVRDAAASVAGRRGAHRFDDVVIYHNPGLRDQVTLALGGLRHRLSPRRQFRS